MSDMKKLSFPTIKVANKVGVVFEIPEADTRMRQLIEGSRCWNSFTMTALRKLIPKPRTVIDVGANVGMSSIEFARWAKKVVAFEPHPELDALCIRNLSRSEHSRGVVIYNMALSDMPGKTHFTMSPSSSLGAHISNHGQTEVEVELLNNLGITDVDFIKIDVEGHELRVLKGARFVIERDKPAVLTEIEPLFLKRYGDTPQDVYDFMMDLGYLPYTPKMERTPKTWVKMSRCRDRLFVHQSKAPKARGFGFVVK